MTVLMSYLWRFWRRKSTLLGLTVFGLFFLLISLHSYNHKNTVVSPNYNHDHHTGEDGSIQVFSVNAGSKKLQQSSNYLPEDEGVKFLPRKQHVVHKDPYAFQVSQETRRKVAAKHRLVDASAPAPSIQRAPSIDEKYDHNFQVSDLEGGDYQPRPQFYMNPPALHHAAYNRGDQGPDQEDKSQLYIPQEVLVHLDLKGAPPKIDYLLNFLMLIKSWGATGILIEYEDTFPFEGNLKGVAVSNHYNKSEIHSILLKCKELDLQVIPLVQTFGHMEFILKHGEFSHLRDNPQMPESICPCHDQAMSLIELYIDQVMALHKDVKHLHIGCDEVYHLGECAACANQGRTDIFVQHVSAVAKYVKTKYPQIESVIIWDDMLRNFMTAEMLPLRDLVVPMVWVYAEEVYRFMPTYNWDRFSEVFPTAWTASAYKGADGPTAAVPNVQKRLTNNLNWLDLMSIEESKFRGKFQGLVITGWSRYDHFAVLAELLPAALPSLATNLAAVTHGYFNSSWQNELYKNLQCADNSRLYDDFIDLESDPTLHEKMSWCFFPGSAIFKMIHNLASVQGEVQEYLTKYNTGEGWLTAYNFRHNFSSPFRVNEGLEEYNRMNYLVTSLIKQAYQALTEVYDDYTVFEWIEQKIYPQFKELLEFKKRAESLKSRSIWPKRPFPILKAVKEMIHSTTTTFKPSVDVQIVNHRAVEQDADLPVTMRPKRLVQAPDYYRHPPSSY